MCITKTNHFLQRSGVLYVRTTYFTPSALPPLAPARDVSPPPFSCALRRTLVSPRLVCPRRLDPARRPTSRSTRSRSFFGPPKRSSSVSPSAVANQTQKRPPAASRSSPPAARASRRSRASSARPPPAAFSPAPRSRTRTPRSSSSPTRSSPRARLRSRRRSTTASSIVARLRRRSRPARDDGARGRRRRRRRARDVERPDARREVVDRIARVAVAVAVAVAVVVARARRHVASRRNDPRDVPTRARVRARALRRLRRRPATGDPRSRRRRRAERRATRVRPVRALGRGRTRKDAVRVRVRRTPRVDDDALVALAMDANRARDADARDACRTSVGFTRGRTRSSARGGETRALAALAERACARAWEENDAKTTFVKSMMGRGDPCESEHVVDKRVRARGRWARVA